MSKKANEYLDKFLTLSKPIKNESKSQIVPVLMQRDGLSQEQAEAKVQKARAKLQKMLTRKNPPEDLYDTFMSNEFGLEPDYIDELL